MNRRIFLQSAAAALALPDSAAAQSADLAPVFTQIEKRHAEAVARLQDWIKHPALAAENKGIAEGCKFTMGLLRDAGFDKVTQVRTDGVPGIFATLDAGAPR